MSLSRTSNLLAPRLFTHSSTFGRQVQAGTEESHHTGSCVTAACDYACVVNNRFDFDVSPSADTGHCIALSLYIVAAKLMQALRVTMFGYLFCIYVTCHSWLC